MTNLKLEYFVTIDGISAASGLFFLRDCLYLISDDSGFLYQYELISKGFTAIPLFENARENMSKKKKPDFESISLKEGRLLVFGSGSSKNRNFRYSFDLESQRIRNKSLAKLYDKCKKAANFGDDDLNIEGSFFVNNKWYLWQRGNGKNGRNGVFVYDKINKHIDFRTIELPIINNFQATFTDCILVEDKIFFLAAAENSSSTFEDGLIYGSLIGCMDLDSFAIIAFEKISDTQKFEGLTLFENTDLGYSFLLCEDNDVISSGSKIYKLTFDKN